MEQIKYKKNAFYYIGQICGLFAILACMVTVGLSVSDLYISIYILATGLALLGLNRIGLHISKFKENMFITILFTAFVFVLAVLVSLTKYNIYFLISSMFGYSSIIILNSLLQMRKDKSPQSLVYHILYSVFMFLFSFVFFFPAIYAKHATSVSNSNFIVLCYSIVIIISSTKNILSPHFKKPKMNTVSKIIEKSMAREILLALMIVIILCSVYFTIVEQSISSYVDALWYSFAVITTIGFGDVSVTTTLGRILSVILGICGIAAVALFTSLIVNFYNEMSKKREEKLLNKIIKEAKEIEKIEEEINEHNKE